MNVSKSAKLNCVSGGGKTFPFWRPNFISITSTYFAGSGVPCRQFYYYSLLSGSYTLCPIIVMLFTFFPIDAIVMNKQHLNNF